MEKQQEVGTGQGMNIISIVWYKVLPPVFGGQKGIAGFNQQLGKRVSLTCLCSDDNQFPAGLSYRLLAELPTTKWQFLQPAIWKKIRQITTVEKATHIILEHPYHGIAAVKARRSSGAKLLIHSHNIESQRFRERGNWGWLILYHYEKWIHRRADLSLFKTEADLHWAIRHFKLADNKCMLLPYGIDAQPAIIPAKAKAFLQEKYNIGPQDKILLFAGTLDYEPNALAVEYIFTEIVPRLRAKAFPFRILICGRNRKKKFHQLRAYQDPLVIWAGEVENIEPYYRGADVFINPVQSGAGIQTKNTDALARHCNLVCFDNLLDRQIFDVAAPKIFPVAPGDGEGFSNQVIKASQQSLETPAVFFETYSWETIVGKLLARLEER